MPSGSTSRTSAQCRRLAIARGPYEHEKFALLDDESQVLDRFDAAPQGLAQVSEFDAGHAAHLLTMPKLKQQAAQEQASLSVPFVAFDVDAKVFEPVKKLGATVVGAADEKQLNTQLEFILQRKILLEDEEPPAKKK